MIKKIASHKITLTLYYIWISCLAIIHINMYVGKWEWDGLVKTLILAAILNVIIIASLWIKEKLGRAFVVWDFGFKIIVTLLMFLPYIGQYFVIATNVDIFLKQNSNFFYLYLSLLLGFEVVFFLCNMDYLKKLNHK